MKNLGLLMILLLLISACQKPLAKESKAPEFNNEVSEGAQTVEKELNEVSQVNEELEINELDDLDQELKSLEELE
ncbi:hypothetical protein HYV79_00120 [Candidatus Woesearchaeota archaeon]|nr:hypothetical protein [Candidatus Woesearchaeota archaeon]